MSEEDLINTYDPDCEENNYHLPHHLFKALQLKHFRSVCSEVLPGQLYISSYQTAANLEALQKNKITHIINAAADICDSCFPEQITYCNYYLKDTNQEDISLLFYRTLEWIQAAIDSGGCVLVHCREGVSRSATMVIAYLMWRFSLSFDAGHDRIRKARPICNPNAGFTCRLLLLGKKLGVGGGPVQSPTEKSHAESTVLLRVTPYHPKEPFLYLVPVEWPASWPLLDPRFGWVVQQGPTLFFWLGGQVVDCQAVSAAVRQHVRWLETFEKCQCMLTQVSEGQEPVQFWQALGLPNGPPPDRGPLAAARPAFDADYELMCKSAAAAREMPAEESSMDVPASSTQ